MSNEISLSVSATLNKPSSMSAAISRSMLSLLRNQVGNFSSYGQIAANSTLQAVPLQGLAPSGSSTNNAPITGAPHYAWFENLDPTTFIHVIDSNINSSAVIAELAPGDISLIPLYANCKPCVQAGGLASSTNSNTPLCEYLIMGY